MFGSRKFVRIDLLDTDIRILTMKHGVVDVRIHTFDLRVTRLFVLAEQFRFQRINGKIHLARRLKTSKVRTRKFRPGRVLRRHRVGFVSRPTSFPVGSCLRSAARVSRRPI